MKKSTLIILGVVLLVVILIAVLLFNVINSSDKFVCTSSQGTITILYKDGKIVGYSASASGYSYNLDEQQDYAEKIGIDKYLEEFNEWFVNNSTNGKCEKK